MDFKKFSYKSIGSHWEITIWDEINDLDFKNLELEILSMSEFFEKKYSRFIESSLVCFLNGKVGKFSVPSDFIDMLKLYKDFYEITNKKFTPLIGEILNDLGYDKDYSLIPKNKVKSIEDFNESIKVIDDENIEILKPIFLDFGGVGKGYFVDKISNILKSKGFKRFLVNGSGDISYVTNNSKIRAGLEHPLDETKVIGVIELENKCFCASGSNRRKWNNYHHIVDPQTISSNKEIVATWVLADSTVIADIIATCLFLVPPENLKNKYNFEYCILNKDMKIKKSEGFNAEFF